MLAAAAVALHQLLVMAVQAVFLVTELQVVQEAKLAIPQLLQLVQVLVQLVMGAMEEIITRLGEMPR